MAAHSADHNFVVIPNFDGKSRAYLSAFSGQVKRDKDEGIIRPIRCFIDHEGFPDFTFYDAEQLAKMIGWEPAGTTTKLKARIAALEEQLVNARQAALAEAGVAIDHLLVDL